MISNNRACLQIEGGENMKTKLLALVATILFATPEAAPLIKQARRAEGIERILVRTGIISERSSIAGDVTSEIASATKEVHPRLTFSLDGKLKVGALTTFKHLKIEGGEVNLYHLGLGAVIATATGKCGSSLKFEQWTGSDGEKRVALSCHAAKSSQ
jgi:hypothetical protein